MGRPINHKKIGGSNSAGNLIFDAWINDDGQKEDCFLVEQISANRFKLENWQGEQEICQLIDAEPTEIGQARVVATKRGGETATAVFVMKVFSITADVVGVGLTDGTHTITLSGGDPRTTPSEFTVVVAGGEVDTVTYDDESDTGYYELPEDLDPIVFTGNLGGGTPPQFSVTWTVAEIEITDGGSGYTAETVDYSAQTSNAPQNTFEIDEFIVTNGAVTEIVLLSGGEDYVTVPTFEFDSPEYVEKNVSKIGKNIVYFFDGGSGKYDIGEQEGVEYSVDQDRYYLRSY